MAVLLPYGCFIRFFADCFLFFLITFDFLLRPQGTSFGLSSSGTRLAGESKEIVLVEVGPYLGC